MNALKMRTIDITMTALFSSLIAVCSWIQIPLVIPFTLQTFAVFCAVGILGTLRGTISVLVYILIGAVGVPVFSGFRGGFGVLTGITGGYIIGFVISALIAGIIMDKFGRKIPVIALSMLAGLIVCYAFGTLQFCLIGMTGDNPYSVGSALMLCVVPYIIPDCLKIALATVITVKLHPLVWSRIFFKRKNA